MNDIHRGPGAPSAAVPALAGFGFLFIAAPPFYVLTICMTVLMSSGNFGGSICWIGGVLAGIIYPAVGGKIWAIHLIRLLSIPAIIGLLAAILADIIFYFNLPAGQSDFAIFLFWFPLAPLLVASGFLIDGLLHQPWFDPNATLEEIGPSRSTIGDYNKQAGMDATGRLSPEKLAAARPPLSRRRDGSATSLPPSPPHA
jgi:hypothetical protein